MRNVPATRSLRSTAGKLCSVSALAIKSRPRCEDALAMHTGSLEGPALDSAGSHAITLLISQDGNVQNRVSTWSGPFPVRRAEKLKSRCRRIKQAAAHCGVGVFPAVMEKAHTLARLHAPFDHPDCLFELKYDGFRALAYVDHGQVRMVSRKGNVHKSFSALCNAVGAELAGRAAVLDGEIVYLDDDGRPQFYSLLRRRGPQRFAAFDLLWLDGRDLRMLPLMERKRRLRALVHGSGCLMYVDHIERAGADFYRVACEQDLEGILAKRKTGFYTPEATTWVKIRNPQYSQIEGRRELFEKRLSATA